MMCKIFTDNKGKLPNDFVTLEETTLHCEYQLDIRIFQPPQPHDDISLSFTNNFSYDYGVNSYSRPLNQMSFEGVSDPSLHPLMINPYLEIRDTLRG